MESYTRSTPKTLSWTLRTFRHGVWALQTWSHDVQGAVMDFLILEKSVKTRILLMEMVVALLAWSKRLKSRNTQSQIGPMLLKPYLSWPQLPVQPQVSSQLFLVPTWSWHLLASRLLECRLWCNQPTTSSRTPWLKAHQPCLWTSDSKKRSLIRFLLDLIHDDPWRNLSSAAWRSSRSTGWPHSCSCLCWSADWSSSSSSTPSWLWCMVSSQW